MTRTNRRYDLSLNPARGRRLRGFAGVFGLWIVLFNLLVATLLGAAAEAAPPSYVEGGKIVVCTGLGMVTLDRDGAPIEPRAPHLCPYCLPIMQGQLDVPVAVAAPAAPVAAAVVAKSPWERIPPAPARAVRAAPARAPPFA
jgi:hypothetical protein